MQKMMVKPWEMGVSKKSTVIPPVCVADFILVKSAPPKGKDIRSGLVNQFLMSAYYDDDKNKIQTIEVAQSEKGYDIKFPLGKKALLATKFRGPKSYHRWLKPNGEEYVIPQDNFTVEYAEQVCKAQHPEWDTFDEITKDTYINDYLYEMYHFAMSQDLALSYTNDEFTVPFVGLQTKLYRVYTPPKEGEKYGNVIITKWRKGMDALSGEYRELSSELATSIYDEWMRRDNQASTDPASFVEEDETF